MKEGNNKKETKKKIKKEEVKPKKRKKEKKNKPGFTLIELLAVIIILGVLLIIAVPSVTKYIDESRKESYITTAKTYISGAKNLVNSGDLSMYDTDTTYYIPCSCIKTETGGDSPYGKLSKAYVAVTFNGKSYDYYWVSMDTAGIGVKYLTPLSELSTDYILTDIEESEITTTVGVGAKSKIKVLNNSDCNSMDDEELTDRINEKGERLVIVYPEGKERADLVIGDIVKIINEEFYVIGYDSSKDELRLLAKYNLNVGSNLAPNAKVGIQNSRALGGNYSNNSYGKVKFAETAYWVGNVGYGKKYPGNYGFNANDTNLANIYDSNCNPYKYVEQYKKYFKDNRVTIKRAEIMGQEEAYNFTISGYSTIIQSTGFWLNTPSRACSNGCVMVVNKIEELPITSFDPLHQMGFGQASNEHYYTGVRPVIII